MFVGRKGKLEEIKRGGTLIRAHAAQCKHRWRSVLPAMTPTGSWEREHLHSRLNLLSHTSRSPQLCKSWIRCIIYHFLCCPWQPQHVLYVAVWYLGRGAHPLVFRVDSNIEMQQLLYCLEWVTGSKLRGLKQIPETLDRIKWGRNTVGW